MARPPSDTVRVVNPPELAPASGYSHVAEITGGRLVYIAGQTASDRHGRLVGGDDLEAQADQAFRNLGAALAAVGCTPRHLVKLTVFLRDMSRLSSYRKARDRFLGSHAARGAGDHAGRSVPPVRRRLSDRDRSGRCRALSTRRRRAR